MMRRIHLKKIQSLTARRTFLGYQKTKRMMVRKLEKTSTQAQVAFNRFFNNASLIETNLYLFICNFFQEPSESIFARLHPFAFFKVSLCRIDACLSGLEVTSYFECITSAAEVRINPEFT